MNEPQESAQKEEREAVWGVTGHVIAFLIERRW